MSNKKSRYIPIKNYIIALVLLFSVIFLFFYGFWWKSVKDEEKLLESYLVQTNTISLSIKTIEELENLILEVPDNYFIFTGFTNDEKERELEEDLKPIIDDYNLEERFYYFNVTEIKDYENFLDELSDIIDIEVTSLPTIIYFEEGKAANKVDVDSDSYLKASDFEKLLEIYNFEKAN